MKIKTFKAKVLKHLFLASKFEHFYFELVEPKRLEFQAGQYILLKVPGVEALRHYSIASPPSVAYRVEVLIDVSPQGKATKYLTGLRRGDEVEFMAPGGQFVVGEPASAQGSGEAKEEELWFIAGGSGIAPLRSMILDLLVDKKEKRKMRLFWGLRNEKDVFWLDDLIRLSEEYDNFNFDLALEEVSESWKLCKGRIDKCVFGHYRNFPKMSIYLCGNEAMIKGIEQKLKERGVAEEKIHYEQFYKKKI